MHTAPAIFSGAVSSAASAMMPPWLKPPTYTRAGSAPYSATASSTKRAM